MESSLLPVTKRTPDENLSAASEPGMALSCRAGATGLPRTCVGNCLAREDLLRPGGAPSAGRAAVVFSVWSFCGGKPAMPGLGERRTRQLLALLQRPLTDFLSNSTPASLASDFWDGHFLKAPGK